MVWPSILRDDVGAIICSTCKFIMPLSDALEAELHACLEDLNLDLARSSLPIIIDTDSAQLVAMVTASVIDRSPYNNLVSGIKFLASQGRVCSFV
jgi:hypothetical protein